MPMPENPYLNVLVNAALTVVFIIVSVTCGYVGAYGYEGTRRFPKSTGKHLLGIFFASPWIVGFLIFVIVPLGFSLYWSFTDYRVTSRDPTIGSAL
jgi:multiple sugar transport system permease protein